MREDAELGDETRVRKQQDRQATHSKVIEKIEVFKETLGFLINVIIAGDERRGGGGVGDGSTWSEMDCLFTKHT